MPTLTRLTSAVFYTLIFASGASGLIYQVVWHRYLVILLGALVSVSFQA